MTLKGFELKENNHFVALEYGKLFSKRTFLVLLTKNYIVGLKVNNGLSVEAGLDLFATPPTTRELTARGSLTNPYSYVKEKYIRKIENKHLYDQSIFSVSKANFRMDRNEIKNIRFETLKVNSLGAYPHDGKIYIETRRDGNKEFVILGDQSGKQITNWLLDRQNN